MGPMPGQPSGRLQLCGKGWRDGPLVLQAQRAQAFQTKTMHAAATVCVNLIGNSWLCVRPYRTSARVVTPVRMKDIMRHKMISVRKFRVCKAALCLRKRAANLNTNLPDCESHCIGEPKANQPPPARDCACFLI